MPVCLVTGATGAIGPRVVDALGRTFEIRTFSRHAPPSGMFSIPVSAVVGDVADPIAVRTAIRGAAVVIHLASLLHVSNPSRHLQAEYTRVNVNGTAAVVDAARDEGVSRVVMVSTIAVYGQGRPGQEWLDEDSPAAPDSPYAETKLAAERMALAARSLDGYPLCTVLRSAAVYGPRVKGNYRRLVRALARRRFVAVGPGTNRRTVIFDADLASAVGLAAVHPSAAGRLYNVSDGTTHTLREIVDAICAALGRRPPRWHLPIAPVRLALGLAALLNRALPRMLDKYLEDLPVRASRIQEDLGFRPRVDLHRGWALTVEEMRRRGDLPRN